nr:MULTISPECIES: thioesterase domain-containing protein [unclassified Streptomyces]
MRPPDPESARRIFCLPYSGGGASMYRNWPRHIGDTEVCAVQLPGRENRMREKPHDTYPALAADLIEGIAEYLDRPFGFFGHCGSALAAYETAAQLAARGGPVPEIVFISSQVAPHDGPFGTFFGMSDAQLAEELRALGRSMGSEPPPDMIDLTLELMRTDMAANAVYHLDQPPRLPCRIAAIGWSEDPSITPAMMTGWDRCGQTTFHTLPGGHYQFLHAPAELVRLLDWTVTEPDLSRDDHLAGTSTTDRRTP